MLIEKDKSSLIIIDVQEKLVSVMPKPHKFIDNIIKLLKASKILKVPMLHSEQYPKGLGKTINKIRNVIDNKIISENLGANLKDKTDWSRIVKTGFGISPRSQGGWDLVSQTIEVSKQIIICGIEAHVCVLQTAINFAKDKKVYVVQDAIASRNEKDYLTALSRLDKHPNIQIVTCEMVLFEWLRTSDHPEFKNISQLIK